MNLYALFEIAGLSFGYIDCAILLIIVLALIFGCINGFVKKLVKSLRAIIPTVGTFFLSPILLEKVPKISEIVTNKSIEVVKGYNEVLSLPLPEAEPFRTLALQQGLEDVKLPDAIKDKIFEIVKNTDAPTAGDAIGAEVGAFLSKALASIIVFAVLFLVALLIGLCFKKLLKGKKTHGPIDSILGAIYNIAIAGFTICCIFYAITLLSNLGIEFLNAPLEFIQNDIGVGSDVQGIAKFLYESNPLVTLLTLIK